MSNSTHSDDVVNDEPPASSSFSWKRVGVTIGTLVILGGVTAAGVWYVTNLEPALHPVKGIVTLDGEPMAGGVVLTEHMGGWPGALAGIEDDGSFELITNGEKGAYAGEHKISFTLTDGGFPPTNLIPDKYADPVDAPFTIEVYAETQHRVVEFKLSGRKEVKPRNGRPTREESPSEDELTETAPPPDEETSSQRTPGPNADPE